MVLKYKCTLHLIIALKRKLFTFPSGFGFGAVFQVQVEICRVRGFTIVFFRRKLFCRPRFGSGCGLASKGIFGFWPGTTRAVDPSLNFLKM